MSYNVHSICRSCLQQSDKMISLFEYCCVDMNNFLLSELFGKCTHLDINKNDNLPEQICEDCLDELISVNRFQEKCQNSVKILKADGPNCDLDVVEVFNAEYITEIQIDPQIEMVTLVETPIDKSNNIFYKCMVEGCNKSFGSLSEYTEHKTTHTPTEGYKCDYCDKIFPRHIMKVNHHRTHTVDRPFKCSVCPIAKTTKAGLLSHLLTHTHKLRCDICDINFKNRRMEVFHMKNNQNCPKHVARQEMNTNKLDNEVATVKAQIDKLRSSSKPEKENSQTQCAVCAFECFTSARLRDHATIHVKAENESISSNTNAIIDESGLKYKCLDQSCDKTFASLISYREHQKIHDPDSAVKCDYCEKMFSSKAKREPHHRTHRGERPYKCSVCPQARGTKSSLLKHLLCHARSLKCKPCAISFESSRSYVAHLKIHADDPNYEPNNDSDPDDEEPDEDQHKLKQQIEEIRSNTLAQKRNINTKCTICLREFATPSELKSHMEVHQDVGCYLCTICNKTSLTKAGYREHMYLHEPYGTFQCEHCDKVFSSSHQLKAHLRKHTGEKPFTCYICGKSCSTANVLLVHNRLHTGEKPFKCIAEGCAAAFRTTSKLNRHRISMHSTKRPYECNVCSKKFAFSDEYKAHVVTHSDKMAHECGSCGKGFMKDYYLKAHLRVHTGEKPYTCELCLKSFRLRTSLNSHLKLKHASDGEKK